MGYWLPVSDWNVNRFLVMLSAIALIVISALGLRAGGSTAHMVRHTASHTRRAPFGYFSLLRCFPLFVSHCCSTASHVAMLSCARIEVVNAVILAFAVLGLVGALTTDIRWMQVNQRISK